MSAAPETDLEAANQEGYNEGKAVGYSEGMEHAAMIMLNAAGEHFKNGNDKLAQICRDQSDCIKAELRIRVEKGLGTDA